MPETLSPPEYASRLGVKVERIHAWIKSGELMAINVSDSSRRPLWRISPEAIAAFEDARTAKPPAPKPRRKRLRAGVKERYK